MAFQFDTSGVVPFDGGTLGVLSWGGLGQVGGLFAQGYVEALFNDNYCVDDGGVRLHCGWGFADLAPETVRRIVEDCAVLARRAGYMVPTDAEQGSITWRQRQNGEISDFPPLTVALNDDGKVVFLETRYPNGAPMFRADGMMLDDQGNRSIFDDIDE